MKLNNKLVALFFLFVCLTVTSAAGAATTRFWQHTTLEDFMQGEFKGTGITSDGTVVPTWSAKEKTLTEQIAWASATVGNTSVVGTSQPGRLYRIRDKNDELKQKELLRTDGLGFTALVKTEEGIYAAESPEGNIYRYSKKEDTAVKITSLPDSYLLSMIPDNDNRGFYVGTGNSANVYHVQPDGDFSSINIPGNEDKNIQALALFAGDLYAGDDYGLLYRREKKDQLKPIYGFPDSEIKSLAAGNHSLYLAVNGVQHTKRQEEEQRKQQKEAQLIRQKLNHQEQTGGQNIPAAPPVSADTEIPANKKQENEISTAPGSPEIPGDEEMSISPSSKPRPSQPLPDEIPEELKQIIQKQTSNGEMNNMLTGRSGGTILQFKPDDYLNILLTRPESPVNVLSLLDKSSEELLVGMGNPARVYKIGAEGNHTVFARPAQEQITGLEVIDNSLKTMTTGKNGAFYLEEEFKPSRAKFRSPPLDAGLLSRWGLFHGYSSGEVSYRLRSGIATSENTKWSEWSEWNSENSFRIPVDPARNLQYEVRFQDKNSRLSKTEIAHRATNQRPQITTFQLEPDPIKDRLFNGNAGRADQSQSSNSQKQALLQLMGEGRDSARQFKWNAYDPDGDELTSTLKYKPENSANWITLPEAEMLDENKYEWKTGQIADGNYSFKLTVSDKLSNPPEESYEVSNTIGPVRIDNSQPEFKEIEHTTDSISFQAYDPVSRILDARYRVNGGQWRKLRPLDGIFGSKTEEFSFTVPEAKNEEVFVEITIADENGNENMMGVTLPSK
ncbi:MAG: hypothetical protein ACQEP7_05710 [bacterium]